ncbi:uncharacterized protein LOC109807706 [Cajanus cajan]|uniref:uncharacterized protein LOC109807706 n=1 Tax=Cajanus cajan TaxID=3821 RepID=UPI00098D795F|nr:uncharacterized protein LOC109807706 [Cajanus cajan]
MSPSMKSKLKSKASKDQQKATPTICGTTNHDNSISGTFHTVETILVATSSPTHEHSRTRNIDDTNEHPSSLQGTVSECDSVSNSGSCSGESEDPKEKMGNSSIRQDSIPGSDNERREKIRLKNERKHQRQRERRALELHDRCCGFLMSRKLESLAQQLVAMGFPSERATLALINSSGNRMSSSFMAGLQNVGMDRDASSSASLREWTSPFAGSDIFSLPRQFVTSPSL